MRDPYRILQVDRGARAEVVAAAYRTLAKLYHPDTGSGSTARMAEINAAFDLIGDEAARRRWDATNAGYVEVRLEFGKHAGKRLSEVPISYLEWILREAVGSPSLQAAVRELLAEAKARPS